MVRQRFTATVTDAGRGRVRVPVPFHPDTVWGAKPRHHIHGTVDGMSMRGVVEPVGDGFGFTLGCAAAGSPPGTPPLWTSNPRARNATTSQRSSIFRGRVEEAPMTAAADESRVRAERAQAVALFRYQLVREAADLPRCGQ
jgi:hypothetical protein